MFTMFREESNEEGKPGPVSMRRVLAFLAFIAAITLFVIGGLHFEKDKWYAFIPGGSCLLFSLLLLFFTTWNDIAEITKALKK